MPGFAYRQRDKVINPDNMTSNVNVGEKLHATQKERPTYLIAGVNSLEDNAVL